MQRRDFLTALAAGTAALLTGCGATPQAFSSTPPPALPSTAPGAGGGPSSPRLPRVQQGTPQVAPVAVKQPRVVSALPKGLPPSLAFTVDDGANSAVVSSLVDFVDQTGIRLTFFVTSRYPSWRDAAPRLRPLVESGQIQLANHTVSHADLSTATATAIHSELAGCERFLGEVFGVTGRPFYRPPYGKHNATVDKVAADLGYLTTTLWYGTLEDYAPITTEALVAAARQWFEAGRVVIGHANQPAIMAGYGELVEIIRSRALQTVTLDDAFYGAAGRERNAWAK